MLKNPVALSFDDHGRLFVVETARRSTVDIDIRGHPTWIVEDLSNQSIEDLRRFFRARMAPEKTLENASWLRDYNGDGSHDWRDLREVKERVHLLEDTRGSGRADRAHVFAEGFNEEISGVIAGVMPYQGDVFVTVYPDLWRLRDRDGDGVAEEKESMFRGFGVHAAFDGHDLHGLTVGPEGKIYFSIGDNGFSVTNREGRWLHYPNTGAVLRMNPDGSDLEVFASGLRNPQEIAFDEFGNLFSVDNDGDLEDERERFVYITEGSDSGWRLHWQFRDPGWAKHTGQPNYNPWIHEKMWVPQFPGQPAHLTPPLLNYSVGPSGFKYNPGTGLNDAYRQCFFLVQFPVRKVTAFQTKPKGAYFEMINERLVLSGLMASAVNFSPDGALFVADWDGLWEPNEKGAIWVLDDPRQTNSPARMEVKRLLREGMRTRPDRELAALLGHADMRIRQRAQTELARREATSKLLPIAANSAAPQLARVHALWALGQIGQPLPRAALPFQDTDPEIRAQAAKIAGDLRLRLARTNLVALLSDPSPRVRFHAALALGKCGDTNDLDALVWLLAQNHDEDAFLRHAAVMGLAGCAQARPAALAALARHPSTGVRIGAVVALRRLLAPVVNAFLHDPELFVRREAVRAIHDDRSIAAALPDLAALLDQAEMLGDEAIARRALNANLRLGTETAARRLLQVASSTHAPEPIRSEAVLCLANWNRRPYLDRVEGMVRPLGDRRADLGNRLLEENLASLLAGADESFTRVVTRVVLANHLAADPVVFSQWVQSPLQTPAVRAQALEVLGQRGATGLTQTLQVALTNAPPEVRIVALRILATNQPDAFLQFILAQPAPSPALTRAERQTALRLAGGVPAASAAEWLGRELDALLAGRLPAEFALDLLEAGRLRPEPAVQAKLAAYTAQLPANDPLARFRVALAGGDSRAGREIFKSHPNAQCVRCHEAGGEGFQAGPVLTGIAKRASAEYLLEALIDPSKTIANGFATLSIETREGEDVDGLKVRETTDAITLRLGSGEIRTIPHANIRRLSTSNVSVMPPMGDLLSLGEIRDLVAYLLSLR
jgi:putative membrane-bound dehydrogenase-like protein